MTAAETICHLSDALKVAIGEKRAEPIGKWFTRTLMKWGALRSPTKWPRGVRTVPECEAGAGGTPPAEMEKDLNELRELVERFSGQPRDFAFAEHPMFGPMTDAEWLRWGYLHLDHHLRQFGV